MSVCDCPGCRFTPDECKDASGRLPSPLTIAWTPSNAQVAHTSLSTIHSQPYTHTETLVTIVTPMRCGDVAMVQGQVNHFVAVVRESTPESFTNTADLCARTLAKVFVAFPTFQLVSQPRRVRGGGGE